MTDTPVRSGADNDVDPRIARTREVVLAATMWELAEVGFERVSIDAVAERSGVARSTIYRNWDARSTLLAVAFRRLHACGPKRPAPGATLTQDLERLGRMLIERLGSDEWSRTVPSLISAAVHDPPMRALLATFSDERAEEAGQILRRALAREEIALPDDLDGRALDEVLERFVAPFFFRRLVSQRPLDEAFLRAQVEAAVADSTGPGSKGGSPGPG